MEPFLRSIPERAAHALQEFFKLEAAAGILLILAAALALLFANSPLDHAYDALLATPVEVRVGSLQIDKPLLLWINDGLMAVFFLLVAMEIKREALRGQLARSDQRVLPLVCALGGVALPAAIYALVNRDDPVALQGWAIPTATDIAFALGILSLLGSRVPLALKVLLSAIAVIDDLAAIVIIAVFYTSRLSPLALVGAGLALLLMFALNRFGVRRISAYILLGIVMWIFVLKSGVHATLAGVATGLLIPMGDADDPHDAPLESLEHALHPWVAYAILPLFAFGNAGLSLHGVVWRDIFQPVPMGIMLGLVLGKTLGVGGAAWLALRCGWAKPPDGVGAVARLGMAVLCGIGFTMSLFIGTLSFGDGASAQAEGARIGILIGSTLCATLGLLILHWCLPRARA